MAELSSISLWLKIHSYRGAYLQGDVGGSIYDPSGGLGPTAGLSLWFHLPRASHFGNHVFETSGRVVMWSGALQRRKWVANGDLHKSKSPLPTSI